MMVYHPTVNRCPDYVDGNERLILNIIINGKAGDLKPFTNEKLELYSDLDKIKVEQAVNELALKNLISKQS